MNRKTAKLILLIVILAAASFFVFNIFKRQNPQPPELLALQQSIISEPKMAANISEEARADILEQFAAIKQRLEKEGFENLKDLEEMVDLKKAQGDLLASVDVLTYMGLIRPKSAFSFMRLGLIYHNDLKRYDLAEENYLRAIANDPHEIFAIRNLFGLYFYDLKDKARAEALLLGSIKENSDAAELYALAGNFYSSMGEKQKALEFFEKHLELNPNNGMIVKEVERLKSEVGQ